MFEKFGMLAPRHSVRMLVASWNRKPSTSPAPRCGQRFAWQFNKTFRIWSLWKFLRHLGLSPRSYMKSLLCVLCPCGFFGETSWKHVVLKLGPNKCSVLSLANSEYFTWRYADGCLPRCLGCLLQLLKAFRVWCAWQIHCRSCRYFVRFQRHWRMTSLALFQKMAPHPDPSSVSLVVAS